MGRRIEARLPFFYGWVIVAVAFVTMGVGVNARTAFSLLFPPIVDEFGWAHGVTAGAFSFGFLVTAVASPFLGRLMDRRGTLARSIRTARFWWIAVGYLSGLYAWYAVQVHQTKYLVEIGFSASQAAWALGFVSLVAVPGQIALGHLSDRIGREWVWTVGNLGFVLCYLSLLVLRHAPTPTLLAFMVVVQGLLGYGLVSVIGAIPADVFQGAHYGTILGSLMTSAIVGGAAGPWATGVMYDASGSYTAPLAVAIGCSALSAATIWLAAPRKVRAFAGWSVHSRRRSPSH